MYIHVHIDEFPQLGNYMKCLQSNLTNSSISTYLSFQMTVLQIFHDKEKERIYVKNIFL